VEIYLVTMGEKHQKNGQQVSERWNTIFKALSSEPRRQIIVSLLDTGLDQSVPLPESAIMPNVLPDPEVLRQELHHHHLPMLVDLGFITWETEPLVASRGSEFDEVAMVFEALHAEATSIPDSLVIGCRRLEEEQQKNINL
jgi:DNA-binding transcriptional ArsR family regulator